jgi:hypothetical protein
MSEQLPQKSQTMYCTVVIRLKHIFLPVKGRGKKSYIPPYNRPLKSRMGVDEHLYYFFNLDCRWGWAVNSTPRPLYPRGRDPFPIV